MFTVSKHLGLITSSLYCYQASISSSASLPSTFSAQVVLGNPVNCCRKPSFTHSWETWFSSLISHKVVLDRIIRLRGLPLLAVHNEYVYVRSFLTPACQLIGPPLWTRLKYLQQLWIAMKSCTIFHGTLVNPTEDCVPLAPPAHWHFRVLVKSWQPWPWSLAHTFPSAHTNTLSYDYGHDRGSITPPYISIWLKALLFRMVRAASWSHRHVCRLLFKKKKKTH